ncbi:MAG: AIR synthase-related protein, partial [Egibacteraceae bacterium]
AATNCLNFGSPERPEVMGQFRDTIRGMAAACAALGTPITGGNVSFYNQTGDAAIHPTPVVGILGLVDDVTRAVGNAVVAPGDVVCLLGAPTRPGLGGSEYLWRVHGRVAGRPPAIDLDAERMLDDLLVAATGDGLLRSAHDVSAGGLLATLVETCLAGGLGARVRPEDGVAAHQWLFSESPTRAVATTADGPALQRLCEQHGVPVHALGEVTDDPTVTFGDLLELHLDEVRQVTETALPQALGVSV